jgi:hypothetical protein
VPTQNRRPPPNAMKCFVPPVISALSCTTVVQTSDKLVWFAWCDQCPYCYCSKIATFYLLDAINVPIVIALRLPLFFIATCLPLMEQCILSNEFDYMVSHKLTWPPQCRCITY